VVERALSLTQPWATLVAINAKRFETRSQRRNYRGWLAIHASTEFPRDCVALCYERPFCDVLSAAGFNNSDDLPRGAVIAIADLTDCRSTNEWKPIGLERAFGNYSPNRFALRMDHVRRTKELIPMKGMLGIWRMPRAITEADLV